jgi:hypothetical protein
MSGSWGMVIPNSGAMASCSVGQEADSDDHARNLQMVVVGIAWGQAFLELGDRWSGDEGEDGPYTGRHGGSAFGVRVRLPLKTKPAYQPIAPTGGA